MAGAPAHGEALPSCRASRSRPPRPPACRRPRRPNPRRRSRCPRPHCRRRGDRARRGWPRSRADRSRAPRRRRGHRRADVARRRRCARSGTSPWPRRATCRDACAGRVPGSSAQLTTLSSTTFWNCSASRSPRSDRRRPRPSSRSILLDEPEVGERRPVEAQRSVRRLVLEDPRRQLPEPGPFALVDEAPATAPPDVAARARVVGMAECLAEHEEPFEAVHTVEVRAGLGAHLGAGERPAEEGVVARP